MSKEKSLDYIPHHVAHHFDSPEQEFESAQLGMWVFLLTEVLFFGGLFVAYIVFRSLYPEMYLEGSHHLSWKMGGLNTLVLITSSFTMVMGVRSFQLSRKQQGLTYLGVTFILAGMFLVVKYFEYAEKIHLGYLPAKWFSGEGIHDNLHLFFGLYFCMTGLHGIHVVIGMGLIAWMMARAAKGEFYADYFTPVEMVGLYWHLVDLIWIFLFPLFYLIG